MDYTTLPSTDIKVSKLCLGTMTFGNQNTEAEGHDQMDYALERGINFFDTAELYPVPATPKTYADTERIKIQPPTKHRLWRRSFLAGKHMTITLRLGQK